MKVQWTHLAGRELIGIRKYIGKNNPEAAKQVASHIKTSVEQTRLHVSKNTEAKKKSRFGQFFTLNDYVPGRSQKQWGSA